MICSRPILPRRPYRPLPLLLPLVLMMGAAAASVGLRPAAADAAGLGETITVSVQSSTASVLLGESLDLNVTVVNNGTEPTRPLVVHLDITDPANSSSVDPEDWTSTLSKPVGVVAAGGETVVDWQIQPISGGDFVVYAVAITPGADSLASSNVALVNVESQRSLNPGGILPVAIAAPTLIAVLLALQMRYARRTTAAKPSPSAALGPT